MRIAVLFDGAGLARQGLEQAGHECHGIDLNPVAHHLSTFVGSGRCTLASVKSKEAHQIIKWAEAAWCSPPCPERSSARTQGPATGRYSRDLLNWCLNLRRRYPHLRYLWVENVGGNAFGRLADWGNIYNAHQFGTPQNRNRCVGGHYPAPLTMRPWRKVYPGICPAITATEAKGCATDSRRASRFFGRRITLDEAARHQDFDIPPGWFDPLPGYTMAGPQSSWSVELYRAIGNGVPVRMAHAFGAAATAQTPSRQLAGHWTAAPQIGAPVVWRQIDRMTILAEVAGAEVAYLRRVGKTWAARIVGWRWTHGAPVQRIGGHIDYVRQVIEHIISGAQPDPALS